MSAVLALLFLAVAKPPGAYVATPAAHVPLVVSSWCWDNRCGAPIAAAKKVAVVPRNSLARIQLRFVPTRARLAVGGTPVTAAISGRQVSWRAAHGGGITLTAYGPRGWVTYVGRLRLKST